MGVISSNRGQRCESVDTEDLDQNNPRLIAGTGGAQRPFCSPDSAFITFARRGELMKIPVAGGDADLDLGSSKMPFSIVEVGALTANGSFSEAAGARTTGVIMASRRVAGRLRS